MNHSELISSSTTGLVPCAVLWFENVRGGSIGLNLPKLMSSSTNYSTGQVQSTTGLVSYPLLWFEQVR